MSERYFQVLRERRQLNTRNYYYIRNLITLSRKQTSKAKETNLMNGWKGQMQWHELWLKRLKAAPSTGPCRSFHAIRTVSRNNLGLHRTWAADFQGRVAYC